MVGDPVIRIESGSLDDIDLAALVTALCLVARQQPDDARPLAATRWLYPERATVFIPPHSWRGAA